MTTFKKGDRVRCINNAGEGEFFTVGKVYTVTGPKDQYGYIEFEADDSGLSNAWSARHFEKVTFKKGDRVRLIDDTNCSAKVGAEATVERVSSHFVYVKWIDGSKVNGQMDGGYDFKQFEVVPKGTFTRLTIEGFPQGGYVVIADGEPALALAAFSTLPEVTAFLERNMA